MQCHWDKGEPCKDCKPAEWIVAWMCERCDQENIFEICVEHYTNYFAWETIGPPVGFACSECHGEVSYITQAIHSQGTTERLHREL
jgi:hypothetical protein